MLQDLRFALRTLAKSPGFTTAALLTLALGIGLATAVFTVADALLLRRLPARDQDRLVVLWGHRRDQAFDYPLGIGDAREFARRTRSLERVAFFPYEGAWSTVIRDGDRTSRLRSALVSGEFFDVLDARPVLGRALRSADDEWGAAPVTVLSYRAWRQRFGGDPHILGRQIVTYTDNVAHTIVGVMPQGLDFPRGTDVWAPILRAIPPKDLSFAAVYLIGRLAPGRTAGEARDELSAFYAGGASWGRDTHGVVHSLAQLVVGDTRLALLVFSAAAALLLLITCSNVANLLLVRGLARVREIAVRRALGASRWKVVRQLLTENALLAVAGGALGFGVAAGAVRLFVAFAPPDVPRLDEIQVNATALAGAVAITGIGMLVFALPPAVITSRLELQHVLRSDTRQSASRRSRLMTEALVAGQVALALLVLSAAGLIARSLIKLERADLSFESSRLLIADLTMRGDLLDDVKKQVAALERLLPVMAALPGVHAVSPVVAAPFSGNGGWDGKPTAEGQTPEEAAANPMLNMEVVTPDYFRALGIPIIRGRGFTDADREGAPDVVIVSQSTARHYWPRADPIGKRFRNGEHLEQLVTVVGVVPDTRYRDLRDARPSIYFPLGQSSFPFAPWTLAIRTTGPPAQVVPAIRRVINESAPGVALVSAAPFGTLLEGPLAQPRLNAMLLAVFAGSAVVLAAIGLFGVTATMVRQRTPELAIRITLGTTGSEVVRLVMGGGLVIAGIGAAVGLLAALATNHLLAAVLYDTSPTDAVTLAIVTGSLLGVAALASAIPARRAAQVDPMVALRYE